MGTLLVTNEQLALSELLIFIFFVIADSQNYEYTNSDSDNKKTDPNSEENDSDPDNEENDVNPDNESNDLDSDN